MTRKKLWIRLLLLDWLRCWCFDCQEREVERADGKGTGTKGKKRGRKSGDMPRLLKCLRHLSLA